MNHPPYFVLSFWLLSRDDIPQKIGAGYRVEVVECYFCAVG